MTTWIYGLCISLLTVDILRSSLLLTVLACFVREKIEPVYELDWGESMTTSGISIHCVPALHFSARGIFDRKPFGAVTQSNFRNNSCIPRATLVSEVILRKFEKTHRNSSWLVGEMIRF
jgi:hypothetical protein